MLWQVSTKCRGGEHKPVKFQFKYLIQRFLACDSHPQANIAKQWSHDRVPEVKKIWLYRFFLLWVYQSGIPCFRQWICCLDQNFARIWNNLHYCILIGRVKTAEVRDKLVDKKVILVLQSTLLRCCSDSSEFLGFSFHCVIRICIWRCCFVLAIGEGSVNAGNELLILDPYWVCLWPPAPCTLTIEKVNARSFTCLCKIDLPNSSPRSKPKSRDGRGPLGGEKLLAKSC